MAFTRVAVHTGEDISGSGGTSIATAGTHNLAAGKLVVVALHWESANTSPTVADTAGNTYVALTRKDCLPDANTNVQLFYCLSSAAHATNVITASGFGAASNYRTIAAHVYTPSGTAAHVAEANANSVAGGASATPLTGSFTAGQAAVAAIGEFSGTSSTPTSPWAQSYEQPSGGSHAQDRIDDPGGTITASTTLGGSASWAIVGASFSDTAAGGGVNTETLEDTIVVSDGTVVSAVRARIMSSLMTVSDGPTIASTIFVDILEDAIDVSDGSLSHMVRNRLLQSGIDVTDEALASVIGNNILTRIMTSQIDVTDGAVLSIIRARLLQDTIIVSEGDTETFITTNLAVDDAIDVEDSIVTRLLLTRLLGDSIDLSDSAIATIVGQNVISSVLSDTILTSDEAVRWMVRTHIGASTVLTADEIVKVMLFTRELTDAIDAADESLTALQRFILLTDSLSVDDGLLWSLVSPTTVSPVVRIGFDQPRIELGGYAL